MGAHVRPISRAVRRHRRLVPRPMVRSAGTDGTARRRWTASDPRGDGLAIIFPGGPRARAVSRRLESRAARVATPVGGDVAVGHLPQRPVRGAPIGAVARTPLHRYGALRIHRRETASSPVQPIRGGEAVNARELSSVVREVSQIRLVTLMAGAINQTAPDVVDLASTAASLVREGIEAAVATRVPLTDAATATSSRPCTTSRRSGCRSMRPFRRRAR